MTQLDKSQSSSKQTSFLVTKLEQVAIEDERTVQLTPRTSIFPFKLHSNLQYNISLQLTDKYSPWPKVRL